MKKIPLTYEECDEDEKFIVDKLREFKTMTEFGKKHRSKYNSLVKYYRYLMDIAFPDRMKFNSNIGKSLIIEFIKKYKRRPSLSFKNPEEKKLAIYLYQYIRRECNLDFKNEIDILCPIDNIVETNKNVIIEFIKLHNRRPGVTKLASEEEKSLNKLLYNYITESSNCFDISYKNEIDILCPHTKFSYNEMKKNKSFENMMSLIPPNVKFKEGQTWKGTNKKYIFICDKFGQFERTPADLISGVWEKGLSGHPKMGFAYIGELMSTIKKGISSKNKKRVINIQTGVIYPSITEVGINNVSRAIKNGTKCGGYNWEYVK